MPICSFADQVRSLELGESVARTMTVDLADMATVETKLSEIKNVKATVNATVSRVRSQTGSKFRVDSGAFIAHDNTAIVMAVSVACTEIGPNHGSIHDEPNEDDPDDI